MIASEPQSYVPGYINYDDLVEGALEGVPEHRQHVRQRHLSTGVDDIASSYFASQYGVQQQQQSSSSRQQSKHNSTTNSRRNSCSSNLKPCSNSYVQSTMAIAAAKIAQLKKGEREENVVKYKEQQQQQQQQLQSEQYSVKQETVSMTYENDKMNGHMNGHMNGQMNEQLNGHMNGHMNGQMNGQMNGHMNGHTNGHMNGHTNGQQNGQPTESGNTQNKGNSGSRAGSRRGSSQFSYLSLLPEDGSFPHRTQPIGDTVTKKTSSTSATPDRELGRKWSVSSSSDYLNKIGRNYSIRSNPIGLAEPSIGRDGYAVGTDGSMYRSTGNLNVAGGSRAGSETRDLPKGNWKERRSSAADLKGTGIRSGGNLAEPTNKPQPCFMMPFGGAGNQTFKRKISKTSVQSSSQSSQSTITRRDRNITISGESSCSSAMEDLSQALSSLHTQEENETINVTLVRKPRDRAQSMPRGRVSNEESSYTVSLPGSTRASRQSSVEPAAGRKTLSRHGSVEIFDAAYNLTVPNNISRHSSQTKLEEVHADHFFFPGVQQESETKPAPVEPHVQCIAVSVHKPTGGSEVGLQGSQFESELSNLTHQINQYTSLAQEETAAAHSLEQSAQAHSQSMKSSSQYLQSSSQNNQSSTEYMQSSSQSMQSSCETMQSSSNTVQSSSQSTQSSSQSVQSSTQYKVPVQAIQSPSQNAQFSSQNAQSSSQNVQSSSLNAQSSSQNVQSSSQNTQSSSQTEQSNTRSRNTSGSNGTVMNGNRFNITNGLKRTSRGVSREDLCKPVQDLTASSAMKQLDSALKQYADQQRHEQIEYVAKVSSRQTSRRCSVSQQSGEEVTTVTVSLPPSRAGSRITSRRGSVDKGKGARRNSLDIYTAEYAIKMSSSNKVDSMQQKSAFHFKVENEAESGLNLCGRCHLPTHSTAECTEYKDFLCPRCLSWDHWEDSCPVQDNDVVCTRCNYIGHFDEVHDVTKYTQRRTCVDLLGWEPFQTWFYETDFRNWWQVKGCVGVPLYRVYPRKSEWQRERQPQHQLSSNQVSRVDSVDDMIAQVLSQRKEYKAPDSADSSGRSTPQHLKNIKIEDDSCAKKPRKIRTFSETLRSLDEDILAELNVK